MATRGEGQGSGAARDAGAFFVLALAITYAIGLPVAASSHGLLPLDIPVSVASLAIFGPAIAALVLSGLRGGRAGVRRLCRPLRAWRISAWWYAIALLLPAGTNVMALVLHVALGGEATSWPPAMPDEFRASGPAGIAVLPLFLLMGSLGEELGWRGYALPRLQARYTALTAALLIGAVWAVWHLPLFLIAGTVQSQIPVAWYGPYILAASVLFTWIYNATGGSLVIVTVFHAAIQGANLAVPILPAAIGDPQAYALAAVITIVTAVVVAMVFGPRSLSRQCRVVHGCRRQEFDGG